jgi:hypothetical protein
MVTALICSAGMGLPVSGFPNMTAWVLEVAGAGQAADAQDYAGEQAWTSVHWRFGLFEEWCSCLDPCYICKFSRSEAASDTLLTVDHRHYRIRHHARSRVSRAALRKCKHLLTRKAVTHIFSAII